MAISFTAIDFETANGSPASPCAVGLVKVVDGQIVDSFVSYIRPPGEHNWLHPGNYKVHGIPASDIDSAPTVLEVFPLMLDFIGDDILVAHNAPFDISVLRASAEYVGLELPDLSYACSLAIACKTYNLESYRLNAVAYAIGHEEFNHHDALADSDACARIIIHAAMRNGASDWETLLAETKQALKRLRKPVAE